MTVEAQGISQGISGWLGLMALQFALGYQLSQLFINPQEMPCDSLVIASVGCMNQQYFASAVGI